jgi:hypothetical protein
VALVCVAEAAKETSPSVVRLADSRRIWLTSTKMQIEKEDTGTGQLGAESRYRECS